ncbi:MAG: MFS transporter [Rhizobiaceae bacterium]|nr:MFS transporter [Rhizobiaceae bacterium]
MNIAENKLVDADWAAIAVVIFGVTAFSVSQGLTYPLISLILAERGVAAGIIGLNGAVFAIGVGASTLMIGPITAVMNGHRLIVSALVGVSVSLALFASFEALWIWFAARFFLGFSASIIFMTSEAWLNTACPDRIRGRISGLFGAGMCAGFAAGPLAIPLFGMEDGFAFALLAVYVAFVAFVTVLLSRKTHTSPEAAQPGMFLQFVFAAPLLIIMVVVFGFADIAAISGLPLYFTEMGYSPSFAAVAVTMLALPTALAQPLFGYLLDTFDRTVVALGAAVLTAAGFLCLPFLESRAAIFIDLALVGTASFGIYTAALTLLGQRYSGGMLVAGSAAFALAYSVGSAAGTIAFGAAIQAFSAPAAPITIGIAVLAFAIAFARAGRRT